MQCKNNYFLFFFIFQKNSAMATLGLKENWKIPLGRQRKRSALLAVSVQRLQKVAIAKFVWKMQKKSGIMKSGLDAMSLFLLDHLLSKNLQNTQALNIKDYKELSM